MMSRSIRANAFCKIAKEHHKINLNIFIVKSPVPNAHNAHNLNCRLENIVFILYQIYLCRYLVHMTGGIPPISRYI